MRVEFRDRLNVQILQSGRRARLNNMYRVTIHGGRGPFKTSLSICVPKNTTTDFASVPRVFWRIIPPWGVYSHAAVVHDYLYQKKGELPNVTVTRGMSDKIFLYIMQALPMSKFLARLMYLGVRVGGWYGWGR